MCYPKPGPRCANHAIQLVALAHKSVKESRDNIQLIEQTGKDMDTKEYEEKMSEARIHLRSAEKEYSMAADSYWETATGRKKLTARAVSYGVDEEQMQNIKRKIKNDEPLLSNDIQAAGGNETGKKYLKKLIMCEYSYKQKKADYAQYQEVQDMVDKKSRPEYIESIETKHIRGSGAGSKFTDPKIKTVDDVMSIAQQQRGHLQGDDREALIQVGADPSSFLPPSTGVRYLMVQTNGTQAIKHTSELPDDTVLTVNAKGKNDGKPASLSLSVDVNKQPTTEFATVIIGPKMDEKKDPIEGTNTLWTMHPGVPTRGIRSNDLREKGLDGGSTITVKELREKFGKDINVNTRLID